jgi:hypothetical protein
MLATFLQQIPSALSRRFLLGSLLPLALFCIGSLLLGNTCVPFIQTSIRRYGELTATSQAFLGAGATLALAAVGLVLAALRTIGRGFLEKAAFWAKDTTQELQRLVDAVEAARLPRRKMRGLARAATDQLRAARELGVATGRCTYPEAGPTRDAIRVATQSKSYSDFEAATTALSGVLRTNSANHDSDDGKRLDQDHQGLVDAIEAESQRLLDVLTEASTKLQARFPGRQAYKTPYGRVAGYLSAYAAERYGVDYAVLWPRIEGVIRKENPELLAALEEASTQFDFHVAMFWLTTLFWIVWSVILLFFGLSPYLFATIALAGPALSFAWYNLGAKSYQALAEQVCSTIDLARLKLFDALGLKRPQSAREEMDAWENIGSVLAFGGRTSLEYANAKAEPKPPSVEQHHVELLIKRAGPTPAPGARP